MTQPGAPKVCVALVRAGSDVSKCATGLVHKQDYGMVCPAKSLHLHPMVTGFCNSGWHEGLKIPYPTCKYWVNCPCECHVTISRMYEMTGEDRTLVDNSTYVPERGAYVRVSLSDVHAQASIAQSNGRVVASSAPAIMPSRVERDFAPTSTGRAARGQLESWVREATDIWVSEIPENCTPMYLSARIAEMQGLDKGPSTGAIDSVFRRWETIGFAVIGSRPTRFLRYTPVGIRDGLEALKARAKR